MTGALAWVTAIGGLVVKALLGWLGMRNDRSAAADEARKEGQADLTEGVKGLADEQAANNAVHRGGASDVADRLRNEIRSGAGPKAGG